MPKVKCLICDEYFDKNNEECIKINNRYIHKNCYLNTEEGMKIQLEEYIKKVMHIEKITPLIKKQIITYYNIEHYSYQSILITLKYFYEIKNGDYRKAKGIGIVPFVYDEAQQYYNQLLEYKNNIINTHYQKVNEIYEINLPKRKFRRKIDLIPLVEESKDEFIRR